MNSQPFSIIIILYDGGVAGIRTRRHARFLPPVKGCRGTSICSGSLRASQAHTALDNMPTSCIRSDVLYTPSLDSWGLSKLLVAAHRSFLASHQRLRSKSLESPDSQVYSAQFSSGNIMLFTG